jgi:uncharacterized protein (DUF39 family)
MQTRTVEDINEKIKTGDVQVLTVAEMKKFVESNGVNVAFNEVDVVTTGTQGAMCSSGALINVGHADPPIKIDKAWINDVPIPHPGAAVDLYIGATISSETRGFEYGGAHVIEDLIAGKEVDFRATAYRNGYQRYSCATNGRDETIYTYMGKLLPKYRNATYSGAGEISPLNNDPDYETLGLGTRIFLGGAPGYIIGEGTQHNPKGQLGTIMVKGDAKQMTTEYINGATFTKYGPSLYVGIGIPIPILNEGIVKKVAIRDRDIPTDIVDYGVQSRSRLNLRQTNYEELKSGKVDIKGRSVKVTSISSLKQAHKISSVLKSWIEEGSFTITSPIERLPTDTPFNPLKHPVDGGD